MIMTTQKKSLWRRALRVLAVAVTLAAPLAGLAVLGRGTAQSLSGGDVGPEFRVLEPSAAPQADTYDAPRSGDLNTLQRVILRVGNWEYTGGPGNGNGGNNGNNGNGGNNGNNGHGGGNGGSKFK
jgi:hypothetical protein